MSAGWNAAIGTWRGAAAPLHENDGWDTYTARMARYRLNEYYYANLQYDNLNRELQDMRRYRRLYTHTRGVYNPVFRSVDVFASKVYPTSIQYETLASGALIVQGDDAVKAGIRQLLRWSNWNASKALYVRTGEKLGDVFLKVVDDPDGERVSLEVIEPQKIKWLEKDAVGNIQRVVIEYAINDEDEPPIYQRGGGRTTRWTYTEVIDRETFTFYRDGVQTATYDNPFGFVPLVHAMAANEGRQFGATRWATVRGKIDELNSQAALLNDQVRKAVVPLLMTYGFEVENDKIAPRVENPDEALNIGVSDTAARAEMLSPTLSIEAALANIQQQLSEIEQDMPELSLYRIGQAGGSLSGVAIRQLYDLAYGKITSAMGVYDDALMRAIQMGLTVGGVGRYRGFEPFGLDSYDRGALDFTLTPRPVVFDGLDMKTRLDFLVSTNAPADAIWQMLEVGEDDRAAWLNAQAERSERGLQLAMMRARAEADNGQPD